MQARRKGVTTDRPRRQPNRKGAADPYTGRCLASPLSDRPGKTPRRSCSGAGKEEGKNAERRCRRKRHGPGLVDDDASRAHEVFSACRGRRAHAVRLRVLKPKRARAGKEESCHSLAPLSLVLASWSVSGTSRPLPHCSDPVCWLCRRHTPVGPHSMQSLRPL